MEETTQPKVDEGLETAQPEAEQEASQLTEKVETKPDEASQPFMRVKYNKEDIELDEKQAREYTEKGMNYDKIKERVTEYEAKAEDRKEVDEFLNMVSADTGKPLSELGKSWMKQHLQRTADEKGLPFPFLACTFRKRPLAVCLC